LYVHPELVEHQIESYEKLFVSFEHLH